MPNTAVARPERPLHNAMLWSCVATALPYVMTLLFWGVLAPSIFLLIGCSGGSNSPVVVAPPPVPPPPAAVWQFQFSPGLSSAGSYGNGGFIFQFPASDGAHYLVKGYSAPVNGLKIAGTVLSVSGTPVVRYVKAADNNCSPNDFPATMSLYLQKAGDNMLDEFGRWWSSQRIALVAGQSFSLDLPTSDPSWGSVYGKTQAAGGVSLPSIVMQAVGVTFGGGCFAGHGAYANGGFASMQVDLFEVR